MVCTIHRKAINSPFTVNARARKKRRHTLSRPASNDGMIDPVSAPSASKMPQRYRPMAISHNQTDCLMRDQRSALPAARTIERQGCWDHLITKQPPTVTAPKIVLMNDNIRLRHLKRLR
jgi:hypothetical protein